jgi:hypothetical protein
MMDTVLNLGLNEAAVSGLAEPTYAAPPTLSPGVSTARAGERPATRQPASS